MECNMGGHYAYDTCEAILPVNSDWLKQSLDSHLIHQFGKEIAKAITMDFLRKTTYGGDNDCMVVYDNN